MSSSSTIVHGYFCGECGGKRTGNWTLPCPLCATILKSSSVDNSNLNCRCIGCQFRYAGSVATDLSFCPSCYVIAKRHVDAQLSICTKCGAKGTCKHSNPENGTKPISNSPWKNYGSFVSSSPSVNDDAKEFLDPRGSVAITGTTTPLTRPVNPVDCNCQEGCGNCLPNRNAPVATVTTLEVEEEDWSGEPVTKKRKVTIKDEGSLPNRSWNRLTAKDRSNMRRYKGGAKIKVCEKCDTTFADSLTSPRKMCILCVKHLARHAQQAVSITCLVCGGNWSPTEGCMSCRSS